MSLTVPYNHYLKLINYKSIFIKLIKIDYKVHVVIV